MALSRKFLTAMGIEDDKIDEIISAHRETVDALKKERDDYKEDAEKLPDVQKELDSAKKKVADFESADGKDKWKVKYDALKEESDKYRADVDAEKARQKKDKLYRKLLKECGISGSEKRFDAILRVTDLDSMELEDNGESFKDVDKLKKGIEADWPEFKGQEMKKGADTETPPEGKGAEAHTPSRAAQVAAKRYEMIYGKKTEETK